MRTNMRILYLIFTVILLPLSLAAQADDTALGAVGGVLSPMTRHPSIRMVSEDVKIKILEDTELSVKCRFVFHNSGAACTVKMGFPEEHGGDSSGLKNFASRVDGKQVKIEHVKGKANAKGNLYGKWYSEGRDWYVKNVHFNQDQTRIVEDEYTGNPSGDSVNIAQTVNYILDTGSAWNGTIGKAVVTADIASIRDFQTISAYPLDCKREGNLIKWEFTDFKPSSADNICISLARDFYSGFVVNATDVSQSMEFVYIEDRKPPALIIDKVLMVHLPQLAHLLFGFSSKGEDQPQSLETIMSESKDHKTYTLTMTKPKSVEVVVTVGRLNALVNGKPVKLTSPPRICKGQLMVPFIQLARALGVSVGRDLNSGLTYIRTKK